MTVRPHTGRRRNDAARTAILDAAEELLLAGAAAPSVDALAAAAGVSKKTIYRWWPSKGAVLLEAMTRRADLAAPVPDEGSFRSDLRRFLGDTFAAAGEPGAVAALGAVVVEAQHDPPARALLDGFVHERRQALRTVLDRAVAREELAPGTDPDLVIDQAFGVLWYRLLVGGAVEDRPVDRAAGVRLADQLSAGARS